MGCACNKGGKTSTYIYTSPNGQKTTYRTEVEAQAAKIRHKAEGGGSYVTVTK